MLKYTHKLGGILIKHSQAIMFYKFEITIILFSIAKIQFKMSRFNLRQFIDEF